MALNNKNLKLIAIFFISIHTSAAYGDECVNLRDYFQTAINGAAQNLDKFKDLKSLADQDNLCAKNLIGRLNFEGTFIPQNIEVSKDIFIELSNRAYPPAIFNLAYVLSKDSSVPPEQVLNLLVGIYATYIYTKEYSYLATKSVEFGRAYIDEFPEKKKAILSVNFENSITSSAMNSYAKLKNDLDRSQEIMNFLAGIVLAGWAVNTIAKSLAVPGTGYTYPAQQMQNPTTLYQIVPTGNSNTLYMLPLN